MMQQIFLKTNVLTLVLVGTASDSFDCRWRLPVASMLFHSLPWVRRGQVS